MKKKNIMVIFITILIAFFAWAYSVGYVPVIGDIIATQKINDYIKEVYQIEENIDVGYDFYNMGNYNADGYLYDLNNNRIIDINLYENEGAETPYKQDYQKIIDELEEGVEFKDYYISCEIDADDYSNKYYKLVVYDLSNNNILSKEESLEVPAKIVYQFMNSMEIQYNFTSVNILYSDNNGEKQIIINGDTLITEEMLIQNTK